MKQLKTALQKNASAFGHKAQMLSIGAGVMALSAGQAFAAVVPISIDGVEEQITAGGTSAGTVAGYVAIALAVLACAGVVFGMLRKA